MKTLVIISDLRMGLFITKEDYRALEEMGEVIRFTEKEVRNAHENPEVYARLEKAVSECDYAFAVGAPIPEELFLKYDSIKAYFIARISLASYSMDFYKKVFSRGQYILSEGPAFSIACAEYALSLILNVMRNTSYYNLLMHQRRESWRTGDENIMKYLEETGDKSLYESTVGIIGFGQIARALVKFMEPFNVNVKAYDPFISPAVADEYGVYLTDLDTVLTDSDVIVLLAFPNETNYHIINRETLSKMKPGARLVNIARSPLIDTEALIEWLKAGKGKAALDVFDREPLEKESELRDLPNVCLSPHRAAGIIDTYNRMGHYVILDIMDMAKGMSPSRTLKITMENLEFYMKKVKTVN